jgi:hypothetical protein
MAGRSRLVVLLVCLLFTQHALAQITSTTTSTTTVTSEDKPASL